VYVYQRQRGSRGHDYGHLMTDFISKQVQATSKGTSYLLASDVDALVCWSGLKKGLNEGDEELLLQEHHSLTDES
jgi:hypothetical protein